MQAEKVFTGIHVNDTVIDQYISHDIGPSPKLCVYHHHHISYYNHHRIPAARRYSTTVLQNDQC